MYIKKHIQELKLIYIKETNQKKLLVSFLFWNLFLFVIDFFKMYLYNSNRLKNIQRGMKWI